MLAKLCPRAFSKWKFFVAGFARIRTLQSVRPKSDNSGYGFVGKLILSFLISHFSFY